MEKKANQQKKNKNLFKEIINSPFSIIVVLILLVIAEFIYTRYLINVTNLYTFSGFTKDVSFLNGTIYTSYDINSFGDCKILYTGEDKKIYEFTLGYYIKEDDSYRIINEMKGRDDLTDGASLKEVLEKSDLSFTEVHKDAQYLSTENIANLYKLVYMLTGKDEKGEEFTLEIPLTIEKVSK